MQKTLIFTFGPKSGVVKSFRQMVLEEAKRSLDNSSRGMRCFVDGDKLVAKYVHKDWNKPLAQGSGSCPENSFWNLDLGDQVQFLNLTAEYTEAILPSPLPDYRGQAEWRDGEFFLGGGRQHRQVTVTCMRSRKIVLVSLDVSDRDKDSMFDQRVTFLEGRHSVESQLMLAQTTQRLIKAFQSETPNKGRVRRFTNKLFMEIGRRVV